jgi:hypothetical protein
MTHHKLPEDHIPQDPGRTPGSAEKGDEPEAGRTADPAHSPVTAEGDCGTVGPNLREQKEPVKHSW